MTTTKDHTQNVAIAAGVLGFTLGALYAGSVYNRGLKRLNKAIEVKNSWIAVAHAYIAETLQPNPDMQKAFKDLNDGLTFVRIIQD